MFLVGPNHVSCSIMMHHNQNQPSYEHFNPLQHELSNRDINSYYNSCEQVTQLNETKLIQDNFTRQRAPKFR